MIKAGSIYTRRTTQRRHTCAEISLPRGKENTVYLKSTSDEVQSHKESLFEQVYQPPEDNERLKVNKLKRSIKQWAPEEQKENVADSFFDSLTQYQRKPKQDSKIKMIICLQQIFREMKNVQSLEKERNGKRWLSDIQNKLLSFQRQLLNL